MKENWLIDMSNKSIKKLKSSISECEMKLNAIAPHLSENKPILNRKFNQLLVEKAVLYDKLKKENVPLFAKFVAKFHPKLKKERICDYF